MSDNITKSFIVEYGTEVHVVFQDKGKKLSNCVRTVNNVQGKSHVFQIFGKGEATEKSRHSKITYMNVDQNTVECALKKYYAAEPVDDLDLYMNNIDEKRKLAETSAMALGRKSDSLIKTAAYKTTRSIAKDYGETPGTAVGFTLKKAKKLHRMFGQSYIFDAGGRNFVFVGSEQFENLLDIDQFANADYIGSDEAPFKMSGLQGKRWLGFEWYTWDSLDRSTKTRKCIAFNENCIGHAIGKDIVTTVSFLEESDDWLIKSKMLMGAELIDETGVVIIESEEE